MNIDHLKTSLTAKLEIKKHRGAISDAGQILAGLETRKKMIPFNNKSMKQTTASPSSEATTVWNEAKAGVLPIFLTNKIAKEVIALAAAEATTKPVGAALSPAPITKPQPSPQSSSAPVATAAEIAKAIIAEQSASKVDILAQFEALPTAERQAFYTAHKAELKAAEAGKRAAASAATIQASMQEVAELRARKIKP